MYAPSVLLITPLYHQGSNHPMYAPSILPYITRAVITPCMPPLYFLLLPSTTRAVITPCMPPLYFLLLPYITRAVITPCMPPLYFLLLPLYHSFLSSHVCPLCTSYYSLCITVSYHPMYAPSVLLITPSVSQFLIIPCMPPLYFLLLPLYHSFLSSHVCPLCTSYYSLCITVSYHPMYAPSVLLITPSVSQFLIIPCMPPLYFLLLPLYHS